MTTPGGNPTSSRMRTSSTTVSGSWAAGFTTTVLPMARAGATLPAMLTSGKLYDVMQATTPTGWRSASALMSPPGASGVATATWGGMRSLGHGAQVERVALEATDRDRAPAGSIPPRRWPRSRRSPAAGAPRPAPRWPAAARAMSAARSAGGVADHAGRASRAAAAAASASATVALGALPTTSSVAGFTTS